MTDDLIFKSQFSGLLKAFILEKRGLGYKYHAETSALRCFDEYVLASGYSGIEISKELFVDWTNRRPHEREKTCENRTSVLIQFCKYVIRLGGKAYLPLPAQRLRRDISYRPHIFTNAELARFLDCVENMSGCIQRRTVFPMLFSLLICTGIRIGEALRLRWIDIAWGKIPLLVSIYAAKFNKDRMIPLSIGLSEQLRNYRETMSVLFPKCEYLFPSKYYVPYSEHEVYMVFRKALWKARISHGGSGHGPRVHDFRHTFAVKSLRKMVYAN